MLNWIKGLARRRVRELPLEVVRALYVRGHEVGLVLGYEAGVGEGAAVTRAMEERAVAEGLRLGEAESEHVLSMGAVTSDVAADAERSGLLPVSVAERIYISAIASGYTTGVEERLRGWSLRPLREVDEFGHTREHREAAEARKGERLASRSIKEEKARALAADRGKKLIERKARLDDAGRRIRDAATVGDRSGALAVLRDLGKKKNESLLNPSFATATPIADLKRQGVVPADLPDVGDRVAYSWEEDLVADDALVALGLAEFDDRRGRGISYHDHLWR